MKVDAQPTREFFLCSLWTRDMKLDAQPMRDVPKAFVMDFVSLSLEERPEGRCTTDEGDFFMESVFLSGRKT